MIEVRRKRISHRSWRDTTEDGRQKSPLFTIFYAVVVNNKRVDSYLKYQRAMAKAKTFCTNGQKVTYLRSF